VVLRSFLAFVAVEACAALRTDADAIADLDVLDCASDRRGRADDFTSTSHV
jgi:hypothetical protein